ncbi:serine hydrolase [Erythrobacter sp.]|uniref:serine hydrolase domain-containing protein n=1 Tax=Erythrobacter sp. TaxID=1042 RepID=UPI0025D5EC2F|nr:serine hydrolase domain-containing protein [Erythrobacter sp.]
MLKLLPDVARAAIAAAVLFSQGGCAAADPNFAYAEFSEGRLASSGNANTGLRYQAGSIAKLMCTIAVLRLSDAGQVNIDAPVSTLLPELAGAPSGQPTLRQIMANRSGLMDGLSPAIETDFAAATAIADTSEAISRFVPDRLAFSPDESFSYDLVNWILVQRAIEKATGEPLSVALEKLVLVPAGMQSSEVFKGQPKEDVAQPSEPVMPVPAFLRCAGGLISTPSDLIRLSRFAYQGSLSAPSIAALETVLTPDENYALGGRIEIHEGRPLAWHTGSNGAYKSLVVYDSVSDRGFSAMTAQGDWSVIEAARERWLARSHDMKSTP